jgi:hypothetical protein
MFINDMGGGALTQFCGEIFGKGRIESHLLTHKNIQLD